MDWSIWATRCRETPNLAASKGAVLRGTTEVGYRSATADLSRVNSSSRDLGCLAAFVAEGHSLALGRPRGTTSGTTTGAGFVRMFQPPLAISRAARSTSRGWGPGQTPTTRRPHSEQRISLLTMGGAFSSASPKRSSESATSRELERRMHKRQAPLGVRLVFGGTSLHESERQSLQDWTGTAGVPGVSRLSAAYPRRRPPGPNVCRLWRRWLGPSNGNGSWRFAGRRGRQVDCVRARRRPSASVGICGLQLEMEAGS